MKTASKRKLNKAYSVKRNHLDPFERLRLLMEWATKALANESTTKKQSV